VGRGLTFDTGAEHAARHAHEPHSPRLLAAALDALGAELVALVEQAAVDVEADGG